jgi:hypothetical protein
VEVDAKVAEVVANVREAEAPLPPPAATRGNVVVGDYEAVMGSEAVVSPAALVATSLAATSAIFYEILGSGL